LTLTGPNIGQVTITRASFDGPILSFAPIAAGSRLELSALTFVEDDRPNDGPALRVDGSGGADPSAVVIKDAAFVGFASTSSGGAVLLANVVDEISIQATDFSNNH